MAKIVFWSIIPIAGMGKDIIVLGFRESNTGILVWLYIGLIIDFTLVFVVKFFDKWQTNLVHVLGIAFLLWKNQNILRFFKNMLG